LKVKKFRVKPRLSSVGRILKSLLSVSKLPPDIEAALPKESEEFLKNILPIATYKTWSGSDIPADFHAQLKEKGVDGAVALTALVVTVGAGPDETLSTLLLKGETTKAQLITALAEDTAEVALQFSLRLLVEEAENDECELSSVLPVSDSKTLSEVLLAVGAEKEGILVDSAGHLSPRFTRVGLAGWIPVNKRRRTAGLKSQKSA